MSEVVETKYLRLEQRFVDRGNGSKKEIWAVRNKASNLLLGSIELYDGWKDFCFFPQGETVFSAGCLKSIVEHLNKLREGD